MEVEVLGQDNLFFKAAVVDVHDEDILIIYVNSSIRAAVTVPICSVRLLPKQLPDVADCTDGDDVEVCRYIESQQAYAWVPMRFRMIKGDFVVVYTSSECDSRMSDIIDADSVRCPYKGSCLMTAKVFHRLSIPIPSDLCDICQDGANHDEFQRRCGAPCVHFDASVGQLIVLSLDESVIKKASLLQEFHIRSLRQKMVLLYRTEESVHKLESSKQQSSSETPLIHREQFTVPREMIGLSIGAQGNNINRAKTLHGIRAIDFDDRTSTFTILADTMESALEARRHLEFVEHRLQVPRDLVSRVVGRNGHNIQSFIDQSGIVSVKIEGDKENSDQHYEGFVPFILVGCMEAVENANLLIDYHITHLKEVDELMRQKRQLDAQLHAITNTRPHNGPRHAPWRRPLTNGFTPRNEDAIE